MPTPQRGAVYPRRCGGTAYSWSWPVWWRGLSPQVRGNPGEDGHGRRRDGSIPAGAGEPRRFGGSTRDARVYPRRCGGTSFVRQGPKNGPGLSPQVRGNPGPHRPPPRLPGSIPAGAGEPAVRGAPAGPRRVYPRRCGGTAPDRAAAVDRAGLSPQVRGNLVRRARGCGASRSIPAGAGEPACGVPSPLVGRVYPRRCGGTPAPLSIPASGSGLSPQVRGNRLSLGLGAGLGRSIPAGAGEPQMPGFGRQMPGVYPRRCGGTRPP